MPDAARFVFSFRSPYAWIAARWVLPRLPADFRLDWKPFYPLPTFENFPPPIHAKVRYLLRDVKRLVEHHGAQVRFPSAEDPNWAVPHCAFLEAEARGNGRAFALAVWSARFERGEDVADEKVISRAAEESDLDPATIVSAGFDTTRQKTLTEEVQRAYDDEGIFGVPTLILEKGTRFWGHDRIEWAIDKGLIG